MNNPEQFTPHRPEVSKYKIRKVTAQDDSENILTYCTGKVRNKTQAHF